MKATAVIKANRYQKIYAMSQHTHSAHSSNHLDMCFFSVQQWNTLLCRSPSYQLPRSLSTATQHATVNNTHEKASSVRTQLNWHRTGLSGSANYVETIAQQSSSFHFFNLNGTNSQQMPYLTLHTNNTEYMHVREDQYTKTK